MITEALQHCRGIGPIRLNQLHEAGVRSWHDVVSNPQRIAAGLRQDVVQECDRCLRALSAEDIPYFVDNFDPRDRWRILAQYTPRASYFDIETTGLEFDSTITVIVCWHRNQLLTFVEHENLDDFLDLLDDVELLVSFNGSTFDVPRLLDGFHIPALPCPHLDLRWPCYYRELPGGLKQVTTRLGLRRPPDLQDVDGELAIRLWHMWEQQQNAAAREQLIRYCAADVLLLRPLAEHLAGLPMTSAGNLWQDLPAAAPCAMATDPAELRRRVLEQKFGPASPTRLRTLRGRTF